MRLPAAFNVHGLVVVSLLALLGWGSWQSPIQAQGVNAIPCTASAKYDASTNGSTQLITYRADRPGIVQICGFTIWAAGTATVKFIYGTGTACATGSTDITPAFSLVTQTGITDSSSFYRGLNAPNANNVCIFTSAGVAVQAILYYTIR